MGRGASKAGAGGGGGGGKNPIADRNFDVSKQTPTKSPFIENMNEAQLRQEIASAGRRIAEAEREAREAYEKAGRLPIRAKGSTDRSAPLIEQANLATRTAQDIKNKTDSYKKALETVKGSGLLVHEARTAREVASGKTDGKWTKTDRAFTDSTFGPIAGQKNGDFTIGKSWNSYRVYKNGKQIGQFSKASQAKAIVDKYAKKKR